MSTNSTKLMAAGRVLERANAAPDNSEGPSFKKEIIRDANDPTRLRFLHWKGGRYSIWPYTHKACPETKFAVRGDLQLPDSAKPFGNFQELFSALGDTICKFVELSKDDAFLVSLYIISTWFPDCVKSVPYLWLVGPLGSGKSTLLKFLHCVCRRAILIGDVRPASLYKLSSLSPTLLIDELEPDGSRTGAEIRRFLRIGNTPGVPAARNGQLFQTFSSKVISSRQPPLDAALASRAIVIRMLPTQRELLPLDRSNVATIAKEFQPRLLMYRLINYMNVKNSQVPFEKVRHLTPRMRDLVQGLTAPLLGQPTIEDKLIAILGEFDLDARIERSLEPEWLVVEALFASWHKHIGSYFLVGGLCAQINSSLEFRGEDFRLKARSVGGVLKSLGLRTRKLGNLGRGLTSTSAIGTTIHELAQRLGFDRRDFATLSGLEAGYGGSPCVLCEKFGLTAGLRFVDLQTRPRCKPRVGARLFDSAVCAFHA